MVMLQAICLRGKQSGRQYLARQRGKGGLTVASVAQIGAAERTLTKTEPHTCRFMVSCSLLRSLACTSRSRAARSGRGQLCSCCSIDCTVPESSWKTAVVLPSSNLCTA